MKAIQGKQAYFGSHTFKATSNVVDGKKVTEEEAKRLYPPTKKKIQSYITKNNNQLSFTFINKE